MLTSLLPFSELSVQLSVPDNGNKEYLDVAAR